MGFIYASEGEEEWGEITLMKHGFAEEYKFWDKFFSHITEGMIVS